MKKTDQGQGSTKKSKDQESKGPPVGLPQLKIAEYFEKIPDFRVDRTKRHLLMDILIIPICAVISGAEDWKEIARSMGGRRRIGSRPFRNCPMAFPRTTRSGGCISIWTRRNCGNVFLAETIFQIAGSLLLATTRDFLSENGKITQKK